MQCPNGLAFPPDESGLCVADTERMFGNDPQHIRFCAMVAGDGVHCVAPGGRLLGKVLVPQPVSNLCVGGPARHRLFITATRSVHAVTLNRRGGQEP